MGESVVARLLFCDVAGVAGAWAVAGCDVGCCDAARRAELDAGALGCGARVLEVAGRVGWVGADVEGAEVLGGWVVVDGVVALGVVVVAGGCVVAGGWDVGGVVAGACVVGCSTVGATPGAVVVGSVVSTGGWVAVGPSGSVVGLSPASE